jgi:hypothetical protein
MHPFTLASVLAHSHVFHQIESVKFKDLLRKDEKFIRYLADI